MRLSQQDVEITIDSRCFLDLGQGQKSSLILGTIKTHKTGIGLQASSLPE